MRRRRRRRSKAKEQGEEGEEGGRGSNMGRGGERRRARVPKLSARAHPKNWFQPTLELAQRRREPAPALACALAFLPRHASLPFVVGTAAPLVQPHRSTY